MSLVGTIGLTPGDSVTISCHMVRSTLTAIVGPTMTKEVDRCYHYVSWPDNCLTRGGGGRPSEDYSTVAQREIRI